MKYIVAAWAIIVILGFILERLGRKKYIKPPVIRTSTYTQSPIGAHQLVHSRDRVGVAKIRPPANFEETITLRHLRQEHSGHPQLDFSLCVRPTRTQRGGTDSGGGEG